MDTNHKTASAVIHERLKHPVIDADGHWIEFEPTLLDYLKQVGGPTLVDRFRQEDYLAGLRSWARMTPEQRDARRPTQPAWLALPAKNSLDRATAMLPRLLCELMPEIGLDFAVMYPTLALFFPAIKDPEVQRAAYRAHNLMAADMFRGLSGRLTPAACIPMQTPATALEELDVAVNQLGLKTMMFTSLMRRPIAAAQKEGT